MAPAVGIEPTGNALDVNGLNSEDSPGISPDLRLLLRVVEAWPKLNGAFKLAILAIVDAMESGVCDATR